MANICVMFSYLHSFALSDFVFRRTTTTFQQILKKARPRQAEPSSRKAAGGSHRTPLRREQPRMLGHCHRGLCCPRAADQAFPVSTPPRDTSRGISHWHVSTFITAKPSSDQSVYRNGAHCSWKTSSSRLQFKIHGFFFSP